jgi:hypothetical protein
LLTQSQSEYDVATVRVGAIIAGNGTGTRIQADSPINTTHMTRIPSLCRIGLWATKENFCVFHVIVTGDFAEA